MSATKIHFGFGIKLAFPDSISSAFEKYFDLKLDTGIRGTSLDMNWLTPKAQAHEAGEKGWGSFATEPISAGETVGSFGGWSVPRSVLATLEIERQHRAIQVDDDQYLVSQEHREPGDCFNHSCEPSCSLSGATVLKARRDISVGEELTFDYATCDDSDYDEFICGCGTKSCRGTVTGKDWQLPELHQKYAGEFSPYLARRIASEF